MKRPLCVVGTVLLAGATASFLLPWNFILPLAIALGLTAGVVFMFRWRYSASMTVLLVGVMLGLLLGGQYQYTKLLPFVAYQNQTVDITGFVTEVRQVNGSNSKYVVRAQFANGLPNATLFLRDYTGAELMLGELFEAKIKLLPEKDPKYNQTYKRAGIAAEATLLTITYSDLPQHTPLQQLQRHLFAVRRWVYEKNKAVFPASTAALVNGMVFGMTTDLGSEAYHELNRAGTSHLLSVSGLHLSIVTMVVLGVFGQLRLPRGVCYPLCMLVVLVFSILVGFSAPVLRSCIMNLLYLLGVWLYQDHDSLTALGISAIIVVILFPHWVLSKGLWLSYLATFGIITLQPGLSRVLYGWLGQNKGNKPRLFDKLVSGLSVSLAAYLSTLPVIVWTSGSIPLLSPFANILVAPFSGIVLIGGILAVLLPPAVPGYQLLISLVHTTGRMILELSGEVAALPFAALAINSDMLLLALALVACFVAVCVAIYRLQGRIAPVLLGITVLLLPTVQLLETQQAQKQVELVRLADVSTLVFVHGSSVVLVGETSPYEAEQLLAYLEYRNVRSVDAWLLPQYKGGAQQGLERISKRFFVRSAFGPNSPVLLQTLASQLKNTPVYPLENSTLHFFGAGQLLLDYSSNCWSGTIGRQKINILPKKYDIINPVEPMAIYMYEDKPPLLPSYLVFYAPLIGQQVFGEERLVIILE